MRGTLIKLITTVSLVAAALNAGFISDAVAGNTVKNGTTPPKTTGVKQPSSGPSGPHRQPVDPSPGKGGDYSGDSAGGSGSGGYRGDPNSPGHKQF